MPIPSRRLWRPSRRGAVAVAAGVVASAVLLLAGCSGSVSDTSSSAEPVASAYDSSSIEATFTDQAEQMHLIGAFLMISADDGEEFSTSYGSTEWGGTEAPTSDSVIRIGSVTKTWTTTVILQLAQEGKLSLGDPVSKYRSDVPNGDQITLGMLLRMRSGLYDYVLNRDLNELKDVEPEHFFDPEELLAIAFAHEPVFAPDAEYQYSNTNTVLLGRIAEEVGGEPLGDLIRKRVLEPAGAASSVFPEIEDADLPEPYAHGYAVATNIETLDGHAALDEEQLAALDSGTLVPTDHTFENPSWAWAAGAGISTADDLVLLARALTDGTLLDAEYQQERMGSVLPQSPDAAPEAPKYGYGIVDFSGFYGHTGEIPGYNTFAARNPDSGLTLVVWANFAPGPLGTDPATAIAKTIVEQLNG